MLQPLSCPASSTPYMIPLLCLLYSPFLLCSFFFFFFNDTATTEIYTLSLHDALPIGLVLGYEWTGSYPLALLIAAGGAVRSEEHTSELQSQSNLVCRLLLEKKKKKKQTKKKKKTRKTKKQNTGAYETQRQSNKLKYRH